MDDSEKVAQIEEFFEKNYPESEVLQQHDLDRGLYNYYVNGRSEGRLVFKISEQCVDDNDIDSILDALSARVIGVLESNPKMEILLRKDFTIEVNDL
tara:strand:- start:465 stop:755 length:291 start_codon:yes stop_codon:yes gene_type:complete